MATHSDSSLTFFAKATSDQWSYVLNQYKEVFKIHAQETRGSRKNGPAELIKLDNWYQDQLPGTIRTRKEPQLVYDELVQLTKWKLLRGKFRPSLLDLVKTNTETAVKNITKKAFKKIPNIASAINALTTLKGIGPATASAILVAYSPDVCPYMADENMLATPGVEATDYTSSEYLNYVQQLNTAVERLKKLDPNANWTPHKVELALWTHYQIKHYNAPLLEKMPVPESIKTAADEDSIGQESNEEETNDNDVDVQDLSDNGVSNGNGKALSEESNEADSNGVDSLHSNEVESEYSASSNGIDSNEMESNGHPSNGDNISPEMTNDSLSNIPTNGADSSLSNADTPTSEVPVVQSKSLIEPVNESIDDNAVSNEHSTDNNGGLALNGESILSGESLPEEKSCDSLKEQQSDNSVTNGIEAQKRKEISSFEDAGQVAKRIKVQE